MRAQRTLAAILLAACVTVLAQRAPGQPSSPNYTLFDPAVAAFGGPGSAQSGSVGYASQPSMGAGGMSSPSFGAAGGFLESNEPQYPDHPVIFGISPAFGDKSGGTVLSISGVHFDYLGASPTVQVFVGGVPATFLNVVSDTFLTCVTPAVPSGRLDVDVSSTWGIDTVSEAFIATPAVDVAPNVVAGSSLALSNYGQQGDLFLVLWALTQTSVPLPGVGTLLVGPSFWVLLPAASYPAPDGVHALPLAVPDDPLLNGLTVYFQSLSVSSVTGKQLTNSSGTTIIASP